MTQDYDSNSQYPPQPVADASGCSAFFKGGCGCLALFGVISIVVLALGGRVRLDLGGVLFLILVGGVAGLITRAIYLRGQRDALAKTQSQARVDDDHSEG